MPLFPRLFWSASTEARFSPALKRENATRKTPLLSSAQKITRTSKITAAVAAAAVLTAGLFTVQANAVHAESSATLSKSLNGIHETLTGETNTITEAHADQLAQATIAEANAVVAATASKVDTTPLTASVASLS